MSLFDLEEMARAARLTSCGRYRYELSRYWDRPGMARLRVVNFILLNPSKADAERDDPTVRRCLGFAKAWGYDGLVVTNLYALRATDPPALWRVGPPDRLGPDNDRAILDAATRCDLVVCGWGSHGAKYGRGWAVRRMLDAAGVAAYRLVLTGMGEPSHPLRLPADLVPVLLPFTAVAPAPPAPSQ